jgi:RIO kinase 1
MCHESEEPGAALPTQHPRSRAPDDDAPDQDSFQPITRQARVLWDDDVHDQEATTYTAATHGPDPVPEWVITDDAARQYDLGVLKTGKEADVHLVQRVLGERTNLLAAKRYRDLSDRMFRNDAKYRRRTGNRRTDLAMAKGTRAGMTFRAGLWMQTEFDALTLLWANGAPVPYPVQMLGSELMLEYLGDDDEAAPRLVHAANGLDRDALTDLYHQAIAALRLIVATGLVHGDLSPYNLLVWEEKLWVIDLPQAVDPLLNPDGLQLLERDVTNVCSWFAQKGVATDVRAVLAGLVSLLRGET